jgi:hypothetical protein
VEVEAKDGAPPGAGRRRQRCCVGGGGNVIPSGGNMATFETYSSIDPNLRVLKWIMV